MNRTPFDIIRNEQIELLALTKQAKVCRTTLDQATQRANTALATEAQALAELLAKIEQVRAKLRPHKFKAWLASNRIGDVSRDGGTGRRRATGEARGKGGDGVGVPPGKESFLRGN